MRASQRMPTPAVWVRRWHYDGQDRAKKNVVKCVIVVTGVKNVAKCVTGVKMSLNASPASKIQKYQKFKKFARKSHPSSPVY